MCTTCGCGHEEAHVYGMPHEHAHPHGHEHHHEHTDLRRVAVEEDLLARNDAIAAANRRHFAAHGVLAVNLVSSPGSGKTTLLVRTIEALRGRIPVAVIEGDQQTSLDADRIRATGAPAVQVNTGKGCHLDAAMIDRAFHHLVDRTGAAMPAPEGGVLMIENVGNLVCPAAFDLGEAERVVVLSVTEGEDKPLKYPDIFRGSSLVIFNKCDLLPYVEFDVARALDYARRANPAIHGLEVSATKGQGMDAWLGWIAERLPARHLASAA